MPVSDPEVRSKNSFKWAFRVAGALAIVIGCIGVAAAQAPSFRPIVADANEALTVNPGFRDWGPATIAGTTILAGNSSGAGGLYAVDTVTGRFRWKSSPIRLAHGTAFVSHSSPNRILDRSACPERFVTGRQGCVCRQPKLYKRPGCQPGARPVHLHHRRAWLTAAQQ